MTSNGSNPIEAPHFTREWLIDALRYVRRDFEAAASGEVAISGVAANDARARSRMEAARRMGLDALADEAMAAIDRAVEEAARLEWPGRLEVRYTALLGALRTLAQASSALNERTSESPHLTYLAETMARTELAAASLVRRRRAERLHGLYVIVDPSLTLDRDPVWITEQAVAGGATAIQLRVKETDKGRWLPLAEALRGVCAEAGAALIINDHPDVAVAVDADGVHLGQNDMPIAAARASLHPWQIAGTSNALTTEADVSVQAGADYVAVGRMFPTGSKADTRPAGPETLRAVRDAMPADGPPLLAIGGITAENAGEVARAGADGICVIAAVTQADDPRAAASRLLEAFNAAQGRGG